MADTIGKLGNDKYGGFTRPILKLKVSEKDTDDANLLVQSFELELTSGYEASYCRFTLLSVASTYSGNELKIGEELKPFKIGEKVEIELGYVVNSDAKTKQVFVGYITSLEFNYTDRNTVTLKVECMDLKVIMMNNSRSQPKKDIKKFSEAASDTLKKYSSLHQGVSISSGDAELTTQIEQYNESDYDFLVRLGKELGWLFFVINGKVIFKRYKELTETSVELEVGPYLMAFSNLQNVYEQFSSVKVVNNNTNDVSQPIEGTVEFDSVDTVGDGNKTINQLARDLFNNDMEKTVIDSYATSKEIAEQKAKAVLMAASMKSITGKISVIGIPEIAPGTYIKINNINDDYNKSYFVTKVRHVMSPGKYTTEVEYGVNKV